MRLTITAFVAAWALLYTSMACASTLYGSSGDARSVGSKIFTVDQSTGAATLLGATGSEHISDLTSDWTPGAFRIWAVQYFSRQLLRINPTDGSSSVVGTF